MFVGVSDFRRPESGTADHEQPHLRAPDDFDELKNLVFSGAGITSRGGTAQQGTAPSAAKVWFLFTAYDSDSTTVIRFAQVGTTLYYKITSGAWTSLKTGLAAAYANATVYKGHMYMVNGTDARDITLANPPTDTAWITLASGATPYLVCTHENRVLYDHGGTARYRIHFTAFFDPNTTDTDDEFKVPDDQSGFYPIAMLSMDEAVVFAGQDWIGGLTGAGPYTFRLKTMPKGAPLVDARAICSMGPYVIYLTPHGPYYYDASDSPPEAIDPFERRAYHNMDFTTAGDTHLGRVGEECWIFFRSKGFQQTAGSNTPRNLVAFAAALWSRLVRVPSASAPTTTSHYYRFHTKRRQWSGPHDGAWSTLSWTAWHNGDKQEVWLGSAWAGGKTVLADQTARTDVNATGDTELYTCRFRSGALLDREQGPKAPFMQHEIQQIFLMHGTRTGGGAGELRAVCDAKPGHAFAKTVPLDRMGPIMGQNGGPGVIDREGGAVYAAKPDGRDKNIGLWWQLEFEETSSRPLDIRGFGAEVRAVDP